MLPQIVIGKLAVQIVAGMGIGKIVKGIIQNNVPLAVTTFQKIQIATASTVISGLLFEQSNRYINEVAEQIDAMINNREDTNIVEEDEETTDPDVIDAG